MHTTPSARPRASFQQPTTPSRPSLIGGSTVSSASSPVVLANSSLLNRNSSSPSNHPRNAAVFPYPPLSDQRPPPVTSVSASTAFSASAPTPGRHNRNHSAGSTTALVQSPTFSASLVTPPHRRHATPHNNNSNNNIDDEDAAATRHSGGSNGAVALHIRGRAAGDGKGGAGSHSRTLSEEDSRGLKKGWLHRSQLLRASKWLIALVGLLFLLSYVYRWLRPDSRSVRVSFVLPYVTLSDLAATEPTSSDLLVFGAVSTWLRLVQPQCVVVYSSSDTTCVTLTSALPGVQCYYLPDCVSTAAAPLPSLTCTLQHTLSTASTASAIALVTPQLVLAPDFLSSVQYVASSYDSSDRFLLVGAITDVTIPAVALKDYSSPSFTARVRNEAKERGQLQSPASFDAVVLSRELLQAWLAGEGGVLPSFVGGGGHYGEYMLVRGLMEEGVTVVDMSQAVVLTNMRPVGAAGTAALEAGSTLGSPLHSLRSDVLQLPSSATSHNHQLMRAAVGVRSTLASLSYTPYQLEGDCPDACVVSPNPDPRWKNVLLFSRYVNPDGYLAILTVNSGYLALAKNWLCWAERIHFRHFVLLAEDLKAADTLRSPNVPVIVQAAAPYEKQAADYGSVEFQETMTYRTEFLMDVLEAGYHFMTADMDAIWLSDPFAHVDLSADLSGQTHKKVKLSGGLVVVRATEAGKSFWREVIRCQRNNAVFLSTHAAGTYEPSMYTEQYCINQLYLTQPPPPAFTRTLLDKWLFPDGLLFFDEQQPQHAGVVPVIIHNNWIKGADEKLKRMRTWGLTSTDDSNTQCSPIPSPPPPTLSSSSPSPAGFSLIIRVMASTSPPSLSALLTRLASLLCSGCGDITLQIDLDRLTDVDDTTIEETVARHSIYVDLLAVAQKFEWRQGAKEVRETKRRRGRMGQWLDGWTERLTDDRTLVLLLDERVNLSTSLYQWVQAAVEHYYLNDETDGRVVGLQLEREELVLGETYWARFPHRRVGALLESGATVYRHQSISPYAQLMFPAAMRRLVGWVNAHSIDPVTALPPATTNNHITPCIPLMISNTWYTPQGDVQQQLGYETDEVWWVWQHRWMYEEGLYSIVTHFTQQRALASHPLGKSGRFSSGANVSEPLLLTELIDSELSLPPLASLPLYSFAFTRILHSPLLSVLPALAPPGLAVQCYSAVDYEAEQRMRSEVEERKRLEEDSKARAAAENKAKKYLSDKAKKDKRKAGEQQRKKQEEAEKEQQANALPAVEIEGG